MPLETSPGAPTPATPPDIGRPSFEPSVVAQSTAHAPVDRVVQPQEAATPSEPRSDASPRAAEAARGAGDLEMGGEEAGESDSHRGTQRERQTETAETRRTDAAAVREPASVTQQGARPGAVSAEAGGNDGIGLASPTAPGAGVRPGLGGAMAAATGQMAQMTTQAGEPGWGEELGERIVWLIGRGQRAAELRLNPPNLGSLEIRIEQEDETTRVSFIVQSGTAREAVEAALPKLRELFNEAGLTLQRFDVAERQTGERTGDGGKGAPGSAWSAHQEGDTAAEDDSVSKRPTRPDQGLIDAYA